jgi:16S rRNA (cytosine1402-N4)-methyltransferase
VALEISGHIPVLVAESLELLAPERGGRFVDCTVGLGGHAEALLAASPRVELVGLDRDPAALARAGERLAPFGSRVRLVEGRFGELPEHLARLGALPIDGLLADLGVSSLQLDTAGRGFSFRRAGPLDMRMGRDERSAAEWIDEASEEELVTILRDYGEEREATRVARAILRARAAAPLATTDDLARAVAEAKPGRTHDGRVDVATRTFQALRIAVNDELGELERLMASAAQLLARDGRLVVISYHSLEDRIVKNRLRELARGVVDQTTGRTAAETRLLELLTKKPLRPSQEEVDRNPRARSARLRAARRL